MQQELIIKKSKFISYSYKISREDEVKDILIALRKEHKKATHFCYAFVLHNESCIEKFNDDGEPSGTAGKPMLNIIKIKKLENVLVVVVRYFGGIKLGAVGLTRAYIKSASLVLGENI